ncbi:hypothetical protein Prum_091500 [Phytohabitans rumicis]|uniref:Uncharacterized protein n=1 Tax=Phytohabitans rumicis TaxID=1076125 RepID=A0A6V8LKV4_9ACTN|nr:hypothetical protein Prum_091500 [Phytohabitans rumicis]
MPSALLHVEVADAAWIEHINEGMQWGSVAFAVVERYNDCLPFTFQTTAEG